MSTRRPNESETEKIRERTVKVCEETATKEKRENREREKKLWKVSQVNLPDTTYKGPLHVFLKSNYERERNALQMGWEAIFPAHNLFCCLSFSHDLSPADTHTHSPPRQDATQPAVCT